MDKLIPDPPVPPLHLDIAADANAERVIDSYLNTKPGPFRDRPRFCAISSIENVVCAFFRSWSIE